MISATRRNCLATCRGDMSNVGANNMVHPGKVVQNRLSCEEFYEPRRYQIISPTTRLKAVF